MTAAPKVASQASTTAIALLVCGRRWPLSGYRGNGTSIVVVLARTQDGVLLVLARKWREYFSRKFEPYSFVEVDEVLVPSTDVDFSVTALLDSYKVFLYSVSLYPVIRST